jgi:hypothetical protein
MSNKLEALGRADLRNVTGGHLHSSPLGSLSLFISRTNDPTRAVAKSFDVLTLSSPKVCAADRVPNLPPLPARTRSRWNTPSPTVTVDVALTAGAKIVARKRRQA